MNSSLNNLIIFLREEKKNIIFLIIFSILISSFFMYYFEKTDYELKITSPIYKELNAIKNYNFLLQSTGIIISKQILQKNMNDNTFDLDDFKATQKLVNEYFNDATEIEKAMLRLFVDQIRKKPIEISTNDVYVLSLVNESIINHKETFQELYFLLEEHVNTEKIKNFRISKLRNDKTMFVGSYYFSIIYSQYENRKNNIDKETISNQLKKILLMGNSNVSDNLSKNLVEKIKIVEAIDEDVVDLSIVTKKLDQLLKPLKFYTERKIVVVKSTYMYFTSTFLFMFLITSSFGFLFLTIRSYLNKKN